MKIEVGSKVKIVSGYGGDFNGRIATVTKVMEDRIRAASKEGLHPHHNDGDDFHYCFTDREYEPITTLTIEACKYYRTRDGRKVGPMEENQMPNDPWPWKSTADGQFVAFDKDGKAVGEYLVDGMKPNLDLIAEWTEDDTTTPETGTLAELNVKQGDVVECVELSTMANGHYLTVGKHYEINDNLKFIDDEGDPCSGHNNKFRIISRAYDTSKTWGEMTDAEKGELLLAWQRGKVIQCWQDDDTPEYWADITDPNWNDDCKFRIKPHPQRETVTLYGGTENGKTWGFYTSGANDQRWSITFDTIDGTPDLSSIKMERV